MTNLEYASSLREIADFFESHPEFPVPLGAETMQYFNCVGRDKLAQLARSLGKVGKEYDIDFQGAFTLTHQFGSIQLRTIQTRDVVCKRVIKEVKHIQEKIIPALIIPEHDEEIVEWVCSDSLLESKHEVIPG